MKNLILIMYLLVTISCVSQKKEIISKSTIKLEGKNNNVRDFMEIGGYYCSLDYPNSNSLMFFEDGTYVSFSFKRGISVNEIKPNMSKSVKSWIGNEQIQWGVYWGIYEIKSDTLVIHYYIQGTFWKGWSFYEVQYKIVDRTTIQPIYSKGLLKVQEQCDRELNISPLIINRSVYSFNSADSLPSSDCWLKEEKWIWRNESDWKDYMERIKKNKKK